MATTSQLLTWIELECHGWQREGPRGSRAILDEAHRLLLANESEQNVVYSGNHLPYLATTNGVYSYNADDEFWKIAHVLLDAEVSLYDYDFDELNIESKIIAGHSYYRLKNVRTRAATFSEAAIVNFHEYNPGTTSTTYVLYGWRIPRRILSDTIQHQMPIGTEDLLMDATMKLIGAVNDHSKMEAAREYIRTILKPKVTVELDSGEQGMSSYITKRAF